MAAKFTVLPKAPSLRELAHEVWLKEYFSYGLLPSSPDGLASSLWEICCFSHSFTIRSPGVLNDSSSDFAFSSISFTSVMIFHLSLYSRFSPLYFNTEYHLLQICITPAR